MGSGGTDSLKIIKDSHIALLKQANFACFLYSNDYIFRVFVKKGENSVIMIGDYNQAGDSGNHLT